MPKLSVAVIGTGAIGNFHLTGYAADKKNVQITAICDINQKRLDEMGDKFGVPPEKRYRDYKKMLAAEKLDAVSICVPNYLHFPVAIDAIAAKLSVLLEKPMVLTQAEARKLRAALKKNPVKLMIAFSQRFVRNHIAAKKLLDKGVIGKPYMIRVRFAHTGPYPGWAQSDWFYNPKQAGAGAMLDMGIHAIDLCQYLIGPVESVHAEVKTLRKKIKVDDNAVMLLDFGKTAGCLGYIDVGWTSPSGFNGVEIMGDKGSLRLEMGQKGILTKGTTKPDGSMDLKSEPVSFPEGIEHWPLQMESFIRYCLDKKVIADLPGFAEGESSLAVALAAGESSRTGRRIKVKRI